MRSSPFMQMKPHTLREEVISKLREAIITGTLPPDSELNQARIALEMGISRGPLREALGQLEQEGFIRNVPYKGVYVTSLTKKYIEDLYALRAQLEVFAIKRFIERVQPEQFAELRELLAAMETAVRGNDTPTLLEVDLAFHRYIVEQADNEPLLQAWTPLEMGVKRCLHARHRLYESIDQIVGTHPALVDAIIQQDANEAARLLHNHIIDAGEQICRHWEHPAAPPVSRDGDHAPASAEAQERRS